MPKTQEISKRCLETRTRNNGLVYRRYELETGERYSTVEIPVSVLKAFGKAKVRDCVNAWQRGQRMRELATERKLNVEVMLKRGMAVPAIAKALGITDARVRQIRKEINAKSNL